MHTTSILAVLAAGTGLVSAAPAPAIQARDLSLSPGMPVGAFAWTNPMCKGMQSTEVFFRSGGCENFDLPGKRPLFGVLYNSTTPDACQTKVFGYTEPNCKGTPIEIGKSCTPAYEGIISAFATYCAGGAIVPPQNA